MAARQAWKREVAKKKKLRKWSQGEGERGSRLAYKTGGKGQGGTGQGAENLKEEEGQTLQGIIVQAWGGLSLEINHKNILQGKGLNQQNPKTREMP